MTAPLTGRRVPDGASWNPSDRQAGDYGFVEMGDRRVLWIVDPLGMHGSCERHDVTEHEDGTVTVSPSILDVGEHRWHGFLERGVWRSV